MRKSSPKRLVIDPRTIVVRDPEAPGVVRLLTVEPTEGERYSHALRLLRAAAVDPK